MIVGFSRERNETSSLGVETKTGRIYWGFGVYFKVERMIGLDIFGSLEELSFPP